MRILIIDMEPRRQRQLRAVLTSLGERSGNIHSAMEWKSAWDLLGKRNYDIIYLSLCSIKPDGFDVVRHVRTKEQAFARVIV